ncbi:Sodium/hydrogen exchanger family-domain-containing protein [Phycomyces blakesleeanus]|uniref:Sodium/hydrogen exchanger family-domain-containing protein n=1 Tax=Phycomyces blakesleeanus TaxID=4837 RepID=A0ABR3B5G5_PHYBL
MALPFGLGIAVSVGLYKLQDDPSVPFSSFLLFLGVAMSITAFPVLARILAELKLLRTKVGAITMASGLINDCTAWVLLALVVALLNSSGGIEALWVFLTAVGYSLFLIFCVRPLYRMLCVKTGSFQNGPSPFLMTVTLLIVLVSAFVTDIIGVHAIFGGFLAGVIVPHEGDLAIKITEKIEDIINIVFLPLYFTLSGLKTQIGLLDTGVVWGYVILVIFLACFGKIVGCTAAAKLCGMTTRESFTIGFLMNCKGLVELIVLNIGHDAGVLNDQVFVIMVVMALVTTFMTTPVVLWLYPEWYQKQTSGNSQDISERFTNSKASSVIPTMVYEDTGNEHYCLVTMLNRVDAVPSMIALLRLLTNPVQDEKAKYQMNPKIDIHVLRLLELTQRASDVMKIRDLRETERQDTILSVLRAFGSLIGVDDLHTRLDFCPLTGYIKAVSDYSVRSGADMIVLPWPPTRQIPLIEGTQTQSQMETFGVTADRQKYPMADVEYASSAFSISHTALGLFIDRGFGDYQDTRSLFEAFQIVVPFVGGPDDRAAVLFALRLQSVYPVNVTVVRLETEPTNLRYATTQSVSQTLGLSSTTSDKTILDTLFVETRLVSRQIVYHTISQSEWRTPNIFKCLSKPLGSHDLVVVGRSVADHTALSNVTHTAVSDLSDAQYVKGLKNGLGKLASELLLSDFAASIVVIQAPVNDTKAFVVEA